MFGSLSLLHPLLLLRSDKPCQTSVFLNCVPNSLFFTKRGLLVSMPTLQCKTTKFEGLVYSVKLDQIELKNAMRSNKDLIQYLRDKIREWM